MQKTNAKEEEAQMWCQEKKAKEEAVCTKEEETKAKTMPTLVTAFDKNFFFNRSFLGPTKISIVLSKIDVTYYIFFIYLVRS